MVIEKCPEINEDTEVYLVGFNDPFSAYARDPNDRKRTSRRRIGDT